MSDALPGHWNCHAHLFGPYDRFPLAAERSYTPAEAPAEPYQSLQPMILQTNPAALYG